MPEKPPDDQQFTEKEVAAILKRAGEVQAAKAADGVTRPESVGTSLVQLQQAAADELVMEQVIRKPPQIAAEQNQIEPRRYAPVEEELPQRTLR